MSSTLQLAPFWAAVVVGFCRTPLSDCSLGLYSFTVYELDMGIVMTRELAKLISTGEKTKYGVLIIAKSDVGAAEAAAEAAVDA